MKARRLISLVAALAVTVATAARGPAATAKTQHQPFPSRAQPARWVMGYFPGYQESLMPTSEITWSALTHIAVGPVIPRANGSLDESMYLDAAEGPRLARELSSAASANGVQPILMVGGGGNHEGFAKAMRHARKAFVRNLYRAMDSLGYTGVDLDLEPVADSDRRPLIALISALRKVDPNVAITFSAIPGTTTFPEGDTPGVLSFYAQSLAPAVDHFALQTYNMSAPYGGWLSWHFAPLYGEDSADYCFDPSHPACKPTSVDFNVKQYLAAGIPASKLSMGIGFYGACWAPETGPGQIPNGGGDLKASDNEMSYTNIQTQYLPVMTRTYDTQAQQTQLSSSTPKGPLGCTWVSYEDAESIAAKGAYAMQKGLGGAIIWTIPQGHINGSDPLLVATRAAFAPS